MIKKTVTYKDYGGRERTESFYFHFTEAEILDMEMSTEGSFSTRVQRMVDAKDTSSLLQIIKKFVLDAYGVKSEDGRRFVKNDEVRADFKDCPAYSTIFMRLVTNDVEAAEFVNGVVPDDMKETFAGLIAERDVKADIVVN